MNKELKNRLEKLAEERGLEPDTSNNRYYEIKAVDMILDYGVDEDIYLRYWIKLKNLK